MKQLSIFINGLIISMSLSANNQLLLNEHVTVHLLCPSTVSYVQVGDQSLLSAETLLDYPHVVRFKALKSFEGKSSLTLVCDDRLYAFEVSYGKKCSLQLRLEQFKGESLINIVGASLPKDQVQLLIKNMLKSKSKSYVEKERQDQILFTLDEIRVKHDLLFMKLSIENSSNLIYRAERPLFLMRDKQVKKAANVQEYPLEPILLSSKELQLMPGQSSSLIVVFKAFSIPSHKVMEVRLSELTQGYTGRDMTLSIENKAIVKAKSF